MKKWSLHIILWVSVSVPTLVEAQDHVPSQFWRSFMLNNPANTALIQEDYRAFTSYRNQWSSVNSPFKTMLAAGEAKLRKGNFSYFGVGATVLNDKAGDSQLGLFQANLSFAYHMRAGSKDGLSAGIAAGYMQRSINIDGLEWDSQFNSVGVDPTIASGESFGNQQSSAIDVSTGIHWSHDKVRRYDIGAAIWHYGQASGFLNNSIEKSLPRYVGNFVWYEDFGPVGARFQALYTQQGGAKQIVVGGTGRYRVGADSRFTSARTSNAIIGGIHYRYQDAILVNLGYEYRRQYEIGLSYDFTTSNLARNNQGRGGFEITLSWKGWYVDRRIRVR
ncbi:MAG: PorP/SprF family type IX secretion system membrane protein [Flavobacteriales bacterium]|nr:PorP/SprF family type IX secretion system membrane protein [Flavobacteriales bacterium]